MKIAKTIKATLLGLFAIAQVVFLLTALKVNASTYTWDGGGGDNNWSTCANWGTDTCPTASDTVVFDGTSTKNSTVDSGFQGAVAGLAINSGYTGTLTLARDLTEGGNFTQAAGTFASGNHTLQLGNDLAITGGTFSAGSGVLALFGNNSQVLACNNTVFNSVTILKGGGSVTVGSNCSLPLGNNPVINSANGSAGQLLVQGSLTGSGLLTAAFHLVVIDGLLPSNHIVGFSDINSWFGFTVQNGATFTATSGILQVGGDFTLTSGTSFASNGGTVEFYGGENQLLSCNNASFNLVSINKSASSLTVGSNCTLPLGNNPVVASSIGRFDFALYVQGVISGSGLLTAQFNKFVIDGSSPLVHVTGFSSASFENVIIQSNGSFSAPNVDTTIQGYLTVTSGSSFTAASGTTHVGGDFTLNSGTTFNANGGTVDFTGQYYQYISCNNATFNLVTMNMPAINYSTVVGSDCSLPLGSSSNLHLNNDGFDLLGTLTGTSTLTYDRPITLDGPGTHLSGFSGIHGGGLVVNNYAFNAGAYSSFDVFNFALSNGASFTAPSGTMHVGGDFTINSGTTFNANNGTLDFTGHTAQYIYCNNASFHFVTFTMDPINYSTTVGANCTFPVGNDPTISLTNGGLDLEGTLTGTGEITFTKGLSLGQAGTHLSGFTGLIVQGVLGLYSATLDASNYSEFIVNGNLTIRHSSSFIAPAADMYVDGDFIALDPDSVFDANDGTVILGGGSYQTIEGVFTFNNLSKTAYGVWLRFTAGVTQTVLGNLYLQGSGALLGLGSTIDGTQWNIDVHGSASIDQVAVMDSNNISTSPLLATNSNDYGNNTNWDIQARPLEITTTTLPNGGIGNAYDQTLQTNYGNPPVSFSLIAGNLPPGLSLDTSSGSTAGEITGTPLSTGTFGFTVQATDGSTSPTQNLTITVTDPTLGYKASDLIGQIDGNGDPIWNQKYDDGNIDNTVDDRGLRYSQGTALDTLHHQLFVSTCGRRVLVYNLDMKNNLIDRIADYVLGQVDMGTDDYSNPPTAATNGCPVGASYDPVHDRLFSVDNSASRVLVYDLSNGIANGMDASYVLGQADFTSSGGDTTQTSMSNPYGGSAYDPTTDYFYVSDSNNARVLVYALSNGVTNGMDATYVIGQSDFVSSDTNLVTQSSLGYTYGIALDSEHHRLFVADWGVAGRVMVYDLNNLHNGMDASYVLGEADFTSSDSASDNNDTPDAKSFGPSGLSYDPIHQRLFVEDDNANRLLVFDVSTITNGEDAIAVIGRPDFISSSDQCWNESPTQNSICDPEGLNDAFDVTHNRLYLSDSSNNRVLIFNFVTLDTASLTNGTTGSHYSQSLSTSNYQGTLGWAVTAGALPAGLSLNATTGAIEGTPTAAGSFTFTVAVTDGLGTAGAFTDSKTYSMTVAQGAIVSKPTSVVTPAAEAATTDTVVPAATDDSTTTRASNSGNKPVQPESNDTAHWLTTIALWVGGFGIFLGFVIIVLRRRRKENPWINNG